MTNEKDFSWEIKEEIAVLSDKAGYTKELNLISYRGKEPVYDLRRWTQNEDGESFMLKGISLSLEEARALRRALNARKELEE